MEVKMGGLGWVKCGVMAMIVNLLMLYLFRGLGMAEMKLSLDEK